MEQLEELGQLGQLGQLVGMMNAQTGGLSEAETTLIVFQPTSFCNLDCSYCYLPNRNSRDRASPDLVSRIFGSIFSFPTVRQRVTVVWHAGEPLVLGASYFEAAFEAVEKVRPRTLSVDHAIQTNGTLIDLAFCEIFKKWNVNIGISIDGPTEINDRYRKYRNGKGSLSDALAGAQILRSSDIPFYVLTVLTKESLENTEAMFEFYRDNGFANIAFNIEEQESHNKQSSLGGDSYARYKEFIDRFWRLSSELPVPLGIREVERAIGMVRSFNGKPPENQQVRAFEIISVDCKGGVSTFSPELLTSAHPEYKSFVLGNCLDASFEEMIGTEIFQRMNREIGNGVARCARECEYFYVCGGGSPVNKLYENGTFDSTVTTYCQLNTKALVDLAVEWAELAEPKVSVSRNN